MTDLIIQSKEMLDIVMNFLGGPWGKILFAGGCFVAYSFMHAVAAEILDYKEEREIKLHFAKKAGLCPDECYKRNS